MQEPLYDYRVDAALPCALTISMSQTVRCRPFSLAVNEADALNCGLQRLSVLADLVHLADGLSMDIDPCVWMTPGNHGNLFQISHPELHKPVTVNLGKPLDVHIPICIKRRLLPTRMYFAQSFMTWRQTKFGG